MWECPLLMPLAYTAEPSPSPLSSHPERSVELDSSSEGSEAEPDTPPAAPTHPIPGDPHERDAEKQAPLAQIAQDKLNDSDAESSQPDEPPTQVLPACCHSGGCARSASRLGGQRSAKA